MTDLLSKETLEEIKNGRVLLMGESKDLAATAIHFIEEFDKAIVAFRNAAQGLLVAEAQLAELGKQEPVAWIVGSEEIDDFKCGREVMVMRDDDEEELEKVPLYSEPTLTSAERERLNTLERVVAGLPQEAIDGGWTAKGISDHAKSLETRIADYDRAAKDPVAWMNKVQQWRIVHDTAIENCRKKSKAWIPLFTAPPLPVVPDEIIRIIDAHAERLDGEGREAEGFSEDNRKRYAAAMLRGVAKECRAAMIAAAPQLERKDGDA